MRLKNLISFEELAQGHPLFFDIDTNPGWQAVFGNDHPIILEIGFGNGNFLIEMALRHPQHNFIGLDFYHKGIRKVVTKIEKLDIGNVRVAYGDARERIPHLFGDNEIQEIFINFPDPWPKKKHHKRRLIKADFVRQLSDRLRPGGKLHIATDFESYAEEMVDILKAEPQLTNLGDKQAIRHTRDEVPKTKYENFFIKSGKTIFYLDFSRK